MSISVGDQRTSTVFEGLYFEVSISRIVLAQAQIYFEG